MSSLFYCLNNIFIPVLIKYTRSTTKNNKKKPTKATLHPCSANYISLFNFTFYFSPIKQAYNQLIFMNLYILYQFKIQIYLP